MEKCFMDEIVRVQSDKSDSGKSLFDSPNGHLDSTSNSNIDSDDANAFLNGKPYTPPKKNRASHNKIEKKYRTNINTKFVELKDAVPTLRVLDSNTVIDFDELEGLAPASKINKATILSKATEYIKHLESKNRGLLNEIRRLRSDPNYTYRSQSSMQNLPIEVINNLQDVQTCHVVMPQRQESQTYRHDEMPIYPINEPQQLPHLSKFPPIHSSYLPSTSTQSHHDSISSMDQAASEYLESKYRTLSTNSTNQSPRYTTVNGPRSYGYSTIMGSANEMETPSTGEDDRQNFTDSSSHFHSYPNIADDNYSLPKKIMVAGVAALVGSNIQSSNDHYHSLNAAPLTLLFAKSIHLLQIATLVSCIYYFVYPLINGIVATFNSKGKTLNKLDNCQYPYYFAMFAKMFKLLSSTKPSTETPLNSFPIKVTSFPTSHIGILLSYMRLLNVMDRSSFKDTEKSHLATPVEHTFNKIILLNLFLTKSPIIGNSLGFKRRIQFLIGSLSEHSKVESQTHNHSKIVEFVELDPSFFRSKSLNSQLPRILLSLNRTKSSQDTARELFGDNGLLSVGCGYNSVYEYLMNTPSNKLNLFELVTILWCVDNVRDRMVKFLSDLTCEDQNSSRTHDDIIKLCQDMEKIEAFVPAPCIKLIKCCKIFKSILNPKDESYLNDSLKIILLSVEEKLMRNANKSDRELCDVLLTILRSPQPLLAKTLQIVAKIQKVTSESSKSIDFISDENRLSLICSIILHQYSTGNSRYGRSLLKYLKTEKTRKFLCSNSISLMSLIAAFNTLIVVLETDDADLENNSQSSEISDANVDIATIDIEEHQILEDLLCGLRLYVGQGSGGCADESADYDILSLHYGLQSELSHKLLELAKELVGYADSN